VKEQESMSGKCIPKDKLIDTGTPGDPAKEENPDTRLDQLRPYHCPDDPAPKDDQDPVLETTREAGQGSG
jgi:hypothetical protein